MKAWSTNAGWAGMLAAGLALGCGAGPSPTSSGSGGAGATGGHTGSGGNGGGTVCTPGTSELCAYSGAPETLGKGACKEGQRVCDPDGLAFGPCQGEVVPSSEICGNGLDEDCDGVADNGCSCTPGASEPCYTGPPGTEGVGACAAGTHICNPDGLGHGACTGQVTPAAESCGGLDTNCDGATAPLCLGQHLWSKRFGGTSDDAGNSIAVDAAGNVVVTGVFEGPVDFGGGPLTSAGYDDIFVAKYDAAGQHLWSKRFGDADSDEGRGVAVDSANNVVLAGIFRGTVDFGGGPLTGGGSYDIFVAKYDAAGQHLWSKGLGGGLEDRATSVAVDSAGNVLLTGYFEGTVDFGGGPLTSAGDYDIFVAKYDAAGQHLWSKRFGGVWSDLEFSIAADSAGNVLLTGGCVGPVDFGGGPLTSAGNEDVFVAKYDAAGQHLWSKRFGGMSTDVGHGITVDAAGNVLLTARFSGSVDFGGGSLTSAGGLDLAVAKYDVAGQHLWSKRFGAAGNDGGFGVATSSAGDVLVTGYFEGTVDFGGGPLASAGNGDIFVAKYDAAGQHVWSKHFGGASTDSGLGVAMDAMGAVLLTGRYRGTADFGGGLLTSAGGSDIFVTKLAP